MTIPAWPSLWTKMQEISKLLLLQFSFNRGPIKQVEFSEQRSRNRLVGRAGSFGPRADLPQYQKRNWKKKFKNKNFNNERIWWIPSKSFIFILTSFYIFENLNFQILDLVKFYRLVKSGLDAVHFNFWKGWNSRMLLIRMNVKKTFKWRYVTILIVYIQFNFIDNTVYTVRMLSMPDCNSCLCINTCINGTNYM